MDPRDFLHTAQRLAPGPSEADMRTAVGRAYYAAFHVARLLLADCGFAVPRADRAHAHLWLRLCHAGHRDIEQAGNALNSLRTERNIADYDLHRRVARLFAEEKVQTARTIIKALELAFRDPLKNEITEAMKDYERDVLREVTWQPPANN